MTIVENLSSIHSKIEQAAVRSGRPTADVTLLAVTKTVPAARIEEAIAAGVTHLGENRVQDAYGKYSLRSAHEQGKIDRGGLTLHMIGTLQRNKVQRAAALFDWVQSLDRPELALDLERAVEEHRTEPLPILVEVNLTGEAGKSGVSKGDLPALLDALASCRHLVGEGLMTIARQGADDDELRQTFSALRTLLAGLRGHYPGTWRHLSMGMSDDYEIAIEEGATIVRLGRAIFGEREA